MRVFKDFLVALSFLSRIPLRLPERYFDENSLKRSVVFFPTVGYLSGSVYLFLLDFENLISRILAIIIVFWLFDLFHFDGLLDAIDGFLNQSNRERRLEIMSKGNVGPFAAFFGMLYVVALWELTHLVQPSSFLLSSVLGRWGMNVLLGVSKPAKQTGLAALLYPTKLVYIALSLVFTIPLLFLSVENYIFAVLTVLVVSIGLSVVSRKKIGGITGDVLGAACMVNQLLVLLVSYAVKMF